MEHEDVKRWLQITKEAAKKENYTEKSSNGSITIVGSGIMCVGHFTLQSLGYIKTCDKLYYCVADPVTELYIKELRPDAMDFYLLYDDDKERYKTYVQMSEILLHEAREDQHVVGIFYGHPGVFVMPSHRALQIASREGITARMLPAPSAEDCLFADLGIDPSFPGCQTFEATDLLLRTRTICTDLHVIIWQVGCVGDVGFRFKGYENDKLQILIDYLSKVYGSNFTLIHYIGPQYPICEPVKEEIKLKDICSPDKRKHVTGISTFYLPPQVRKKTDSEMSKLLGLPTPPKNPVVRVIDKYDTRETSAISEMGKWKLPENYQFSVRTPLSNYLQNLSTDPKLPEPKTMPVAHRRALTSKHPGMIRTMLKRPRDSGETAATTVAKKIFLDAKFASTYLGIISKENPTLHTFTDATEWLKNNGYNTTIEDVHESMTKMMRNSLLPWTNRYQTKLDRVLDIDGTTNPPVVVWGNAVIQKFTFKNSLLTWKTTDGNVSNAEVNFTMQNPNDLDNFDPNKLTTISLRGSIWTDDEGKPDDDDFKIDMTPQSSIGISAFRGSYEIDVGKEKHTLEIVEHSTGTTVAYDSKSIRNYTYNSFTLTWFEKTNSENAKLFLLQVRQPNGVLNQGVKGKIWTGSHIPSKDNARGLLAASPLRSWAGSYRTTIENGGKWSSGPEILIEVENKSIVVKEGGVLVANDESDNNILSWEKKDGTRTQIQFYRNEDNDLRLSFYGYVWNQRNAKPRKANFHGYLDTTGLTPWSGYFSTLALNEQGKWVPGDEFVIVGTAANKTNKVVIHGKDCSGVQFNNPVLNFVRPGGKEFVEVTLYLKSHVRKLTGYSRHPSIEKTNQENVIGTVDKRYLLSWTGKYYTCSRAAGGPFKPLGPSLTVIGNIVKENSSVSVDDITVTDWQYENPEMKLKWKDRNEKIFMAQIKFYFPDSAGGRKVISPSFAGILWQEETEKPKENNWIGNQEPPPPPINPIAHATASPSKLLEILIAISVGVSTMIIYAVGKKFLKNGGQLLSELYKRVRGGAEEVIEAGEEMVERDSLPEPPTQTTTETTTDTTTDITTETTTDITTETTTDITTETTTDVTTDVTTDITTDVVTDIIATEVEVVEIMIL